MIITRHFVYIHTSRSAGTFLNKLIMDHVPEARMVQYHGHLKDLPETFSHLPVIGFVRNPWDWYVSMYFDYRRKQQYVLKVLSEGRDLDFVETVSRFLKLGDGSDQSRRRLSQLVAIAPKVINAQTRPRQGNPGLRSDHFASYPEGQGYYSWLFQLMYKSSNAHQIHIGRFENLNEEVLRLFELTGTPVTQAISDYLAADEVLNSGPRPPHFIGAYPADLEQLVADNDKDLIDQFGYDFSTPDSWSGYPKTDFFSPLGTTDISALLDRVKNIPESLWESEDERKPNKIIERLNDTKHIAFRFVDNFENSFDFQDHALWEDWKDVLLPIMDQAAKSLGYSNYRFPRVMLARLPAGSTISPHTDRMASHYIHKIHVPLITNPETIFHVGSKARHMPVGEVIEVNNKRNHAVENNGPLDRIHLIFECYNLDDYGKPS